MSVFLGRLVDCMGKSLKNCVFRVSVDFDMESLREFVCHQVLNEQLWYSIMPSLFVRYLTRCLIKKLFVLVLTNSYLIKVNCTVLSVDLKVISKVFE